MKLDPTVRRHAVVPAMIALLAGCAGETAPKDDAPIDSEESDLAAPCAGAACATLTAVTDPSPYLESVGGSLYWLERSGLDAAFVSQYSLKRCTPSANDCATPEVAATFAKAHALVAAGDKVLVVTRSPLTIHAFDPASGAVSRVASVNANEGSIAVDPDGQSIYVLANPPEADSLYSCAIADGRCKLIAARTRLFWLGANVVAANADRLFTGGSKLLKFEKGSWARTGGDLGGPSINKIAISAAGELFTSVIVAGASYRTALRRDSGGLGWTLDGQVTGMGSRGIKASGNYFYAGAMGHGDVFANGNGFIYRLNTKNGAKRVAATQQMPIAVAVDAKAIYWINNTDANPSIRMTKR